MTLDEKNLIMMNGFYNELEKSAQLATIFKVLARTGKFFKGLGTSGKMARYAEEGLKVLKASGKEGLRDYVSAFRHPKFMKGGKGIVENPSKYLAGNKAQVERSGGWLQSQLAEKAEMFGNIKKGPKEVIKGYGQELRDARYKKVDLGKKTWFGQGKTPEVIWDAKRGGAAVKGQGIMSNRQILNLPETVKDEATLRNFLQTNKNFNPIIKKRIGMQALGATVTTPGMMAMPFLGGFNGQSTKDSIKDGLTNYIPGGWEGRMLYDLAT